MTNGEATAEEEEILTKGCISWGPGFICGIRSWIIAIAIVLGFLIVAVQMKDIEKLFNAVMLVVGFYFGSKMATGGGK